MHAIDFIKAILKNDDCEVCVYFYGYAVKQAFFNDEPWRNFTDSRITLLACSTVAESYIQNKLEVLTPFKLAGLGQWMESVVTSNKRIEFV